MPDLPGALAKLAALRERLRPAALAPTAGGGGGGLAGQSAEAVFRLLRNPLLDVLYAEDHCLGFL